jgi:hypothetical protein
LQNAIAMAQRTLFHFHLERVGIVTADTGVVAIYVSMLGIVDLAIILIATFDLRPIEGRCGGIVVDIAETKRDILASIVLDWGNDDIHIFDFEACDLRIDRSLRLTTLMADETAGGIAKPFDNIRNGIAILVGFKTGEGDLV